MRTCMYVCMFVCVHVYVCVYVCMCVFVCVLCVCACVCQCVYCVCILFVSSSATPQGSNGLVTYCSSGRRLTLYIYDHVNDAHCVFQRE